MADVEKFVDQKWGVATRASDESVESFLQRAVDEALLPRYREGLIEAIKLLKDLIQGVDFEGHDFGVGVDPCTCEYCCTKEFLKGLSDD